MLKIIPTNAKKNTKNYMHTANNKINTIFYTIRTKNNAIVIDIHNTNEKYTTRNKLKNIQRTANNKSLQC